MREEGLSVAYQGAWISDFLWRGWHSHREKSGAGGSSKDLISCGSFVAVEALTCKRVSLCLRLLAGQSCAGWCWSIMHWQMLVSHALANAGQPCAGRCWSVMRWQVLVRHALWHDPPLGGSSSLKGMCSQRCWPPLTTLLAAHKDARLLSPPPH
eukprot:scaffold54323_cov18-Tisochrysis_lutea.AAC.5